MNLSPIYIQSLHLKWVDENKFLPEHTKKEMRQIVIAHHQLMMASLGAIELVYRRALDEVAE